MLISHHFHIPLKFDLKPMCNNTIDQIQQPQNYKQHFKRMHQFLLLYVRSLPLSVVTGYCNFILIRRPSVQISTEMIGDVIYYKKYVSSIQTIDYCFKQRQNKWWTTCPP